MRWDPPDGVESHPRVGVAAVTSVTEVTEVSLEVTAGELCTSRAASFNNCDMQ